MNLEVDPASVGIRIREIRKNLGLSMAAFADRINKIEHDKKAKSGTVSNWETGKNLPNNKRLKIIAELGLTTVDFILYGSLDDYARSLLNDLEKELNEDDSINKGAIPLIVDEVENRLFPKYLRHSFNDKDSLEKTFDEYKKDAIELWTNFDELDVQLATMIGSQLSATLTDSLKYFYADFYKNADNSVYSEEKISKMSDEFISRLQKLNNFNRTYVDALRFLDNDEISKKLDKIDDYTDDLQQQIIL
ncbi:MAG: helix-turn-helix transcriptional regulator [Trichococcus flocculiformis]|uniref:Helix-turn-helix transcriptional regulator n=1 Tax=Trichococcus flocculiformis TaxID=82803 RepID=A0A847D4K4_9LACT|nr:helix-turn-helix transcriptional regulator [Trichococcus flocculiformis]NLD32281.1 helix-turn-helix transcriptional regulator [Trichococcus flocculiformis]